MSFVSSLSRLIPSRKRVPLLVTAAAALLLGACADKHIGRPCIIGADTSVPLTDALINAQALECPSRVCVLPASLQGATGNPNANPPVPNDGPFCTDGCGNDDDCAGAERRGPGNPFGCLGTFKCRTIIPRLSNNTAITCKPICVCEDFLDPAVKDVNVPPLSCK